MSSTEYGDAGLQDPWTGPRSLLPRVMARLYDDAIFFSRPISEFRLDSSSMSSTTFLVDTVEAFLVLAVPPLVPALKTENHARGTMGRTKGFRAGTHAHTIPAQTSTTDQLRLDTLLYDMSLLSSW
jgi:hypothetical protein